MLIFVLPPERFFHFLLSQLFRLLLRVHAQVGLSADVDKHNEERVVGDSTYSVLKFLALMLVILNVLLIFKSDFSFGLFELNSMLFFLFFDLSV